MVLVELILPNTRPFDVVNNQPALAVLHDIFQSWIPWYAWLDCLEDIDNAHEFLQEPWRFYAETMVFSKGLLEMLSLKVGYTSLIADVHYAKWLHQDILWISSPRGVYPRATVENPAEYFSRVETVTEQHRQHLNTILELKEYTREM